jgi:hypothetical protein
VRDRLIRYADWFDRQLKPATSTRRSE